MLLPHLPITVVPRAVCEGPFVDGPVCESDLSLAMLLPHLPITGVPRAVPVDEDAAAVALPVLPLALVPIDGLLLFIINIQSRPLVLALAVRNALLPGALVLVAVLDLAVFIKLGLEWNLGRFGFFVELECAPLHLTVPGHLALLPISDVDVAARPHLLAVAVLLALQPVPLVVHRHVGGASRVVEPAVAVAHALLPGPHVRHSVRPSQLAVPGHRTFLHRAL